MQSAYYGLVWLVRKKILILEADGSVVLFSVQWTTVCGRHWWKMFGFFLKLKL